MSIQSLRSFVLAACLLLQDAGSAADSGIAVSGKVLNQVTHQGLAGITVNLIKLSGAWKFWTLPDNIVIGSATTDAEGTFVLQSAPPSPAQYIVDIETGGCWLPYRKIFESERDGRRVKNLQIETRKTEYCR